MTQAARYGFNSRLKDRIQGNPILMEAFKLIEKEPEVILLLEAYLMFKTFTEEGSAQSLTKVIEQANEIIELLNMKSRN